MFAEFWYSYLYQPLFNALIWIYSGIADKNMGWAVIWMTIFLRVFLLPLTIISERNAIRQVKAEVEAETAVKAYKNDAVAQKDIFRKVMNKYRISPWAKVITLGIQVLVLVLLYQVFVGGIGGEKMFKTLYPILDFPGKINNNFYGFDIGRARDMFWAGVCAVYLFMSILIENRGRKRWQGSEVTFLVIFPLFTAVILWFLPMVKSLFILTSMVFSDTITVIRKLVFPVKKVG